MENQYFNEELSSLEFNYRVLQEAMDELHPLLERVKFLAIFSMNLNEFFMTQIKKIEHKEKTQTTQIQLSSKIAVMNQSASLFTIRKKVAELSEMAHRLLKEQLVPELEQQGLSITDYSSLKVFQKDYLRDHFKTQILPVLTPLIIEPGHPFPHISNNSLNLVVVLYLPEQGEIFARLKVPTFLPRLCEVLPDNNLELEQSQAEKSLETKSETKLEISSEFQPQPPPQSGDSTRTFIWLEQIIQANLEMLFEGIEVKGSYPFQVLRNSDIKIAEEDQPELDLIELVEQSLTRRRFGEVVYLALPHNVPEAVKTLLMSNLQIEESAIYPIDGPLGLKDLMQLYELPLPHLKDPPFQPRTPTILSNTRSIFDVLKTQDILLHHPYDDFEPVVNFISSAARDKDVLAIKQTIYRIGTHSPIAEALADAALKGKQVTVMVELKARFDEESNLEWARTLEKVGVNVVYGSIETKTHAKLALVVRREPDGLRRYVHMGTGNYNPKTARMYTDFSFLTGQPQIGEDATTLFNSLTGLMFKPHYHKLLVAPVELQKAILTKIDREIAHARAGRPAQLIFKMNGLTELISIDKLYEASRAGVKIDLIIRGSCRLVPGVADLSENIRVISLVGRFLEHSRIYYFRNGSESESESESESKTGKRIGTGETGESGKAEVYMGSADLMPRNLHQRVETLFPIEDLSLKQHIVEDVLKVYLKDTQKARLLSSIGDYERVKETSKKDAFGAQAYFLTNRFDND